MAVDYNPAIKRRLGIPERFTWQQGNGPNVDLSQQQGLTGNPPPAPTPGQPPVDPNTSVNNYDFDPEYDAFQRQMATRQNFLNSQYDQGLNSVNTNFQVPYQQLQQNQQLDTQSLAGRMAQQGITRSSNNLVGQGKLQDAYMRKFGDLLLQKQNAQESLGRNKATGMQQLLEDQIAAQSKHTEFVAEKEKERAYQEAQTKMLQEALKRQQDYNNSLQQQATDATNAYNQMVHPPPATVASPTGAVMPNPAGGEPNFGGGGPNIPGLPPGWWENFMKSLWG